MDNCIFCQIIKGDAESWQVYENENVLAFFDIQPVSRYHTLVIPKQHYTNIFDIPEAELREVIAGVHAVVRLYQEKLDMQDVQILSNSGSAAQQDVFHLHFHVIPRHRNDGQNIHWRTNRDWVADYDEMFEKVRL